MSVLVNWSLWCKIWVVKLLSKAVTRLPFQIGLFDSVKILQIFLTSSYHIQPFSLFKLYLNKLEANMSHMLINMYIIHLGVLKKKQSFLPIFFLFWLIPLCIFDFYSRLYNSTSHNSNIFFYLNKFSGTVKIS